MEAAVGVLSVWPFGPDPTVGFWGSTVTQYYIRNVIDLGVPAASYSVEIGACFDHREQGCDCLTDRDCDRRPTRFEIGDGRR